MRRERGRGADRGSNAATAYAMKGDEERALAAGRSGYITKPIDTRQLPLDIERFLAS